MKNILNFRNKIQKDKIYNFPEELIKEGLIKSFEYEELISLLKNMFNKYKILFDYKLDDFSLRLTINRKDFNNNEEFIDKFEKLLYVSGYNISNFEIDDNSVRGKGMPNKYVLYGEYDKIVFDLNKKYDTEMKGIPMYLYHVTKIENLTKIEKNGIYPKALNRLEKHPDRVYVFDNLESARFYAKELIDRFNDDNLIILKLDTRLTNELKLRKDPKFGENGDFGAYYTDNHFSPQSIIENINI